MKNDIIRIFNRGNNGKYTEFVKIDDEKNTIKIYQVENEIGFPFSEYETSLTEYGYKSAEDYYRSIKKRVGKDHIVEVDAAEQTAKEINGLVKLAKYREDNGGNRLIKLEDGTLYDDIVERLKAYNLTEEKAIELINLYINHNIERHAVKVFLKDGNSFTTAINGTIETIKNYYSIGSRWNIGTENDDIQECIQLAFIY